MRLGSLTVVGIVQKYTIKESLGNTSVLQSAEIVIIILKELLKKYL